MKEIEIQVFTVDGEAPKTVRINEEATIEELLLLVSPTGHESLFIVLEDASERCERHHKLVDCGIRHGHGVHCHPHVIHYKVDGEPQETKRHKMTPVEIMKNAGVNASSHYLIRLKGKHEEESFKDNPEKEIHLHDGMRFITASLEPTPVS